MKKYLWSLPVVVLALVFLVSSAQAATTGDLIMTPDSSAVYYLGEDGMRYVFPDEHSYYSWYPDFEDVKVISAEDLASLPLGDIVDIQAGTDLVKVPYDPTVYAVESEGMLRPLKSEEQAVALYGADWAERVVDMADTFFVKYDIGEPLADGELPEGMWISEDDGDLLRVDEDGNPVEVDDLLSEHKAEMMATFAQHYDEMAAMYEETFGEAFPLPVDFDAAALDIFFLQMADQMDIVPLPVPVVDSEDSETIEFDEIGEEEDATEDLEEIFVFDDDADDDGMKDWWEEKEELWKTEFATDLFPTNEDGSYRDADGDNRDDETGEVLDGIGLGLYDDWWGDHEDLWDQAQYDEYYDHYYDIFEGEMPYDLWYEDYDDFWANFDYTLDPQTAYDLYEGFYENAPAVADGQYDQFEWYYQPPTETSEYYGYDVVESEDGSSTYTYTYTDPVSGQEYTYTVVYDGQATTYTDADGNSYYSAYQDGDYYTTYNYTDENGVTYIYSDDDGSYTDYTTGATYYENPEYVTTSTTNADGSITYSYVDPYSGQEYSYTYDSTTGTTSWTDPTSGETYTYTTTQTTEDYHYYDESGNEYTYYYPTDEDSAYSYEYDTTSGETTSTTYTNNADGSVTYTDTTGETYTYTPAESATTEAPTTYDSTTSTTTYYWTDTSGTTYYTDSTTGETTTYTNDSTPTYDYTDPTTGETSIYTYPTTSDSTTTYTDSTGSTTTYTDGSSGSYSGGTTSDSSSSSSTSSGSYSGGTY